MKTLTRSPWPLLYALVGVVALHLAFHLNYTPEDWVDHGYSGHYKVEAAYFDTLPARSIYGVYALYFIIAILAVRVLQLRHNKSVV